MAPLPKSFLSFRERFPKIAETYDALGSAAHDSGPLDTRTRELVKLGIAIGARQEGAVHSHTRRALEAGASHDEILHTLALAVTSIGFSSTVAAYTWVNDVLESK
jgi:AhpD family alkylhydroperoxidase